MIRRREFRGEARPKPKRQNPPRRGIKRPKRGALEVQMIMRSAAAIRFFTPEIRSQLPPTHPQLSRSQLLRQGPAPPRAPGPVPHPAHRSTSTTPSLRSSFPHLYPDQHQVLLRTSRPMYAPRASTTVSPAPVPQKLLILVSPTFFAKNTLRRASGVKVKGGASPGICRRHDENEKGDDGHGERAMNFVHERRQWEKDKEREG